MTFSSNVTYHEYYHKLPAKKKTKYKYSFQVLIKFAIVDCRKKSYVQLKLISKSAKGFRTLIWTYTSSHAITVQIRISRAKQFKRIVSSASMYYFSLLNLSNGLKYSTIERFAFFVNILISSPYSNHGKNVRK